MKFTAACPNGHDATWVTTRQPHADMPGRPDRPPVIDVNCEHC